MQNSSAIIRMNPSDYEKTNLGQDHHSRGQSSATTHRAMKMLVLGASGGVGKHLVRLACDQGHIVTALVRRADGIDSRARILIDDVLRPGCFDEHVRGHEIVLSALGIKRTNPANPWSVLASPPDFSSRTAAMLASAMRQQDLARVIALSAAGVADSAARMNLLMKFFVAKSNVGIGYRDLAAMERAFADSGLVIGAALARRDSPMAH